MKSTPDAAVFAHGNGPQAAGGSRWPSTFAALRYHKLPALVFRPDASMMGTWMQSVAQGWLVYQLTGSEFALGPSRLWARLRPSS